MYSLTQASGPRDAWARGVTGKDVTVALIDTGVVRVPGLDKDDKVIDGPDLSFESQSAGTRYLDGYGHGTHLAGIIAGKDDGFDPKKPQSAQFAGVAPDAKLLNMKVATGDGGADVVAGHRRHRLGGGAPRRRGHARPGHQPLLRHRRRRRAGRSTRWPARWRTPGTTTSCVVAAAGNDGLDAPQPPDARRRPARPRRGCRRSPRLGSRRLDDVVADFTNGGSAARRPDVLAPGKSVVSLRVPGSYVDAAHPEGRLAGDDTGRFFRGSGTSQAAAVVSGEAALLFSAQPKLTAGAGQGGPDADGECRSQTPILHRAAASPTSAPLCPW